MNPRLISGRVVLSSSKYRQITTKGSAATAAVPGAKQIEPQREKESTKNDYKPREKWQHKTFRNSFEKEDIPVHTVMTFEQTFKQFAKDVTKVNPQIAKYQTVPDNEWKSFFYLLGQRGGISYNALRAMRAIIGIKSLSRKELMDEMTHEANLEDQAYMEKRVEVLGPDLAGAYFSIYRGGRARFHGDDKWYIKDINDECELPGEKDLNWKLREIDASRMKLLYNGLENFRECKHLEVLKLFGNEQVDDFFIDRICYHFSDSLTSLDVGYCKRLTIGGITALIRLKKLKRLVVSGLEIPHLALACLCLEEEIPGIEIIGVNYNEVMRKSSPIDSDELQNIEKSLQSDRIQWKK